MMKHTLFLLTALLGLLLSGCSTQKISDDQIISDLIGKQVGSYNYRALQEVVDYKIELKNENDNIKEYEVLLIMKEMETNRYYFHHLLQTYILKDDKFEVGQNSELHFFRDFPFTKISEIDSKSGNESWSGKVRFGNSSKNAAIVLNGKDENSEMKTGYFVLDDETIEIKGVEASTNGVEEGKWLFLFEGFSDNYGGVLLQANRETVATDTWELAGELSTDLASQLCCGKFSLSATVDAFEMYETFYDEEKSILK